VKIAVTVKNKAYHTGELFSFYQLETTNLPILLETIYVQV